MFNLDQAIKDWRRRLAGVRDSERLDELEAHLREEIDQQIQAGADPAHAFSVAVSRIGQPDLLVGEFAKLKGERRRSSFLSSCCAIFAACMFFINLLTLLVYELTWLERVLGLFAVSVICLYLAWLPRLLESLGVAARWRMAKACKVLSLGPLLWPVWALLEAEHVLGVGMGIVPAMVLWCLFAAVAMTCMAFSLGQSNRSHDGPGGSAASHPARIPPMPPAPADSVSALPLERNLNPLAREVLHAASEEALRLGHDYIGTEHVLLGVIRLDARGEFLQKLGLDAQSVQTEIERSVASLSQRPVEESPPFTPRARKALRLAAKEARKLTRSSVGPEHIMLGLLLEGGGIASKVLQRFGIGIKRARHDLSGGFGVGTIG